MGVLRRLARALSVFRLLRVLSFGFQTCTWDVQLSNCTRNAQTDGAVTEFSQHTLSSPGTLVLFSSTLNPSVEDSSVVGHYPWCG